MIRREMNKEGVVNLLVETIDNCMVISQSDLNAEQTVQLVQFLVDKLEQASGIEHDEILEDLKYNDSAEDNVKEIKE